MYFEGRELQPHSQPISGTDLHEGAVYFAVNYIDEDMLIPIVETLVFIGNNLKPDDVGKAYFQDVESYREGIPYDWDTRNARANDGDDPGNTATEEEGDGGSATFFCGSEDELNHIFKYEDVVDELIRCSIRRKEAGV